MTSVKDSYRTILPTFDSKSVSSNVDYKLLVETASDLVFITDPNGYFTFTNPTTENQLGFDRNELIGKHLLDFVREDYRKRVFEFYRKQYKDKTAKTKLTFPINITSGNEIWIEINVKSIIERGEVTGFMAVAWDVTENIKTSDILRAINKLAKELLSKDDLNEIVWLITQTTIRELGFVDCVVYLIDETEQRLNQIAAYGPKNPKGREIKAPITLKIGEGIAGAVALTGEPEIIKDTSKDERYIIDDDFRYSEIAVPIIDNNEIIGVIDSEHPDKGFFTKEHLNSLTTVANLVSAQLRGGINKKAKDKAKKELEDNEEKLRSIVNSSMDAIITFNHKGEITEWNPQASVIFGKSKKEAIGQSFLSLTITESYRDRVEKGLFNNSGENSNSILDQRLEITGVGKDDKKIPLEITFISSNINGKLLFSAFIRDISVQIKSKREIEKALQKEKEVNELKTKFVSLASHEFRTPLTTIQTSVDLLKLKLEGVQSPYAEECERNLDRIENEVDRLTKFIGDLLNLGKVDSGMAGLQLEPVNLIEFSHKIIEDHFSQRKDKRKVDVIVVGEPQEVPIDPNIFAHVLINLITNSFKYSFDNKNTRLIIQYDEKIVRLTVEDQGIGIAQDEIPKLFDSFFRAKNAADIQGTGLGLFIVKQFVDLHKGKIKVKSTLGEGSAFIIELNYTK